MADDGKEAGSWWKTLPGVLTGIGSTVAAVAALVVALSQAGLIGAKKSASEAEAEMVAKSQVAAVTTAAFDPPPAIPVGNPASSVPQVALAPPDARVSPAPPERILSAAPPAAGRSLFSRLAQANIHNSVGDATMKNWLADHEGGYRRLAEASLALLGGRALTGQGADLDVVSFVYVKAIGVAGDDLPANHQIRLPLLRTALLKAYANKNGHEARSLDDIVK